MKIKKALTFDDVLLKPKYSEILPKNALLETQFTKNLKLSIPIVSAAMDTVTESEMAIAMAKLGGIGIIHKNMSIEKQAEEVKRVKKYETAIIENPITLTPDDKVKDAKYLMDEKNISGIPIVKNKKLVGIITKRDIKFEENNNKKIKELMTKKVITADFKIPLKEARKVLIKNRIEKLPLVDSKGNLKALITIRDIENRIKYPQASKDKKGSLLVGAGVSVGKYSMERVEHLIDAGADIIVVDTAHGHSKFVLELIKDIKRNYKKIEIIGGNVATKEATIALIKAGVDAVKVGIGPGSICTTRVVAGVGVPQLSAVMESVAAANEYKIPIIADGGIKQSGDIVKALAAGANSVMIGSILAGCKESPGKTIIYKGRKYKYYRGMGSLSAMKEGGGERYFQEEAKKYVPEGVEGMVDYKGAVDDVIFQLIGGLRSGMGYLGAKNLKMLKKNAEFVEITNAGLTESKPHDIYESGTETFE